MVRLEGGLLWAGVGGYAVAVALLLVAAVFARERLRGAGAWLAALAWLAHGGAIVVRWIATGHAPVQGAYENSLAGAWFLPLLGALAARWYRPAARALPVVLALALVILGNGIMAPAVHAPLEPPYRSNWLVIHVAFAWLSFGAYLVVSALAGQLLWITRGGRTPERAPALDEVTARLVAVGFLGHSVMIASGAIWAHGLWGRYWAWDPIETWSLVTWLLYGAYLHLRFTLGWSGRRAAWIAVGAAVGVLLTFFGIGVVSQLHTQLL